MSIGKFDGDKLTERERMVWCAVYAIEWNRGQIFRKAPFIDRCIRRADEAVTDLREAAKRDA